MKCLILYIAVANGERTSHYCTRFVATWHEFPPLSDCDLLVACNGGPLPTELRIMFASLNAKFWPRANDGGKDISTYIEAAKTVAKDYDMILCLGESVHFFREGWLKRLVEARARWGEGMYGIYGSHVVRAHFQTTAFFVTPRLLAEYPLPVTDKQSRYAFEHGERSLWRRLHARGQAVKLATWDGCYDPKFWRTPANVLWKGDQSNCLMHCNHTERFANANETRKRSWQMSADRMFK